jgi:AcrR family transcriptional regulator
MEKQEVRAHPGKADDEDTSCGPDIREKLLDVAERLFAQNGIAETTVRAITGEAGVNVAAVNYYFRSKEDLYREVIDRRRGPLNEERLRLLAASLERAKGKRPAVQEVLRALAEPSLRVCFEYPYFARLSSRLRFDRDSDLWVDFRTAQSGLIEKFREAFAASLPGLPEEELRIRLHYVLGAIQQIWSHCPLPADQSPEALLDSFLAFYEAGLRAPAPSSARPKRSARGR